MSYTKPLIVEPLEKSSGRREFWSRHATVHLEENSENFVDVRNNLARFAELEKSPGGIQTYKLSPLSIWNAVATGVTSEDMMRLLDEYSEKKPPAQITRFINEIAERYGKVVMEKVGDELRLYSDDKTLVDDIEAEELFTGYFEGRFQDGDLHGLVVWPQHRGNVKQALTLVKGYPVMDLAGYTEGAGLDSRLELLEKTRIYGEDFSLWPFQNDAANVYGAAGSVQGGNGVIVLPCGTGKTIVAMEIMKQLQKKTLIVVNNLVALNQWTIQLLDKTDIDPDDIGEYSSKRRQIRPVTIATYNILAYRDHPSMEFPHFGVFDSEDWGLVIYDEVHLIPAPLFRKTAEIQATKRLGLTATLVREDGLEDDIFSLIGPKRYDMPWKVAEEQGYIAEIMFGEIRVDMAPDERALYDESPKREMHKIAARNSAKRDCLEEILNYHKGDSVLVIGYYLDPLEDISKQLNLPLITGKTPQHERVRLYRKFREGDISVLMLSTVGNFAVDLPDANVMIQLSGSYGSRQEEAQRAGRIARLKAGQENRAYFYTIVSKGTREVELSRNRQMFMAEQGYAYKLAYTFDELRNVAGMPAKRPKRKPVDRKKYTLSDLPEKLANRIKELTGETAPKRRRKRRKPKGEDDEYRTPIERYRAYVGDVEPRIDLREILNDVPDIRARKAMQLYYIKSKSGGHPVTIWQLKEDKNLSQYLVQAVEWLRANDIEVVMDEVQD